MHGEDMDRMRYCPNAEKVNAGGSLLRRFSVGAEKNYADPEISIDKEVPL